MTRSRKPVLHITGSRSPRPSANRVIFCDGGVDGTYRPQIDLELSHWIPNLTPEKFKASTTTEICIRFAESADIGEYDLVINNHVDVDGVLSAFVLLHPELSLQHRNTIVQAAAMGDFGSWGDQTAQHLFQAIVCLMGELSAPKSDPLVTYLHCFERTQAILSGAKRPECARGLAALQTSVARIEDGSIVRTLITERLVHYAIPITLARNDLAAALHIPSFNAPLSSTMMLLPNARAKFDLERVQLVSAESDDGIYYDLWYPGYTWAETVQLWRPPGVQSTGSSNSHTLKYLPLDVAVAELQRLETCAGKWTLARNLSPFATLSGRNFPVVLSFTRDERPRPSKLPISVVVHTLARAFA
jgi:hypothetical protein